MDRNFLTLFLQNLCRCEPYQCLILCQKVCIPRLLQNQQWRQKHCFTHWSQCFYISICAGHYCSAFRCVCAWSCSTLFDPVNCSPRGSSVHGIFQARILEWDAIFSSRGSSEPSDQTHVSYASHIGRWVLYQLYHLAQFLSVLANVKHT